MDAEVPRARRRVVAAIDEPQRGQLQTSGIDGERGAFYQAMLDVVDGRRTMDEALADVEEAWQAYEAEETGGG